MDTTPENQPRHNELTDDRILYASADDQVRVRRRVSSAGRWPQHSYPIICLDVKPKEGTRIRIVRDAQGERVDLCLTHAEQVALVKALNAADPSVRYGVPERFPTKPSARKRYYDGMNARRWAAKRSRHKD